jgi:hypothetical protein
MSFGYASVLLFEYFFLPARSGGSITFFITHVKDGAAE